MGGIRIKREERDQTTQPDWRHGIWNRWLISYLTPKDGPDPNLSPAEVQEERKTTEASPPIGAEIEPPEAVGPQASPDTSDGSNETWGPTLYRAPPRSPSTAAKARLDALSEQLFSVEGALDSLTQRLNASAAHDRVGVRRMTDGVDRLTELTERHTEILVSCVRALERLERRLMDAERRERTTMTPEAPRPPETPSRRPPASGARLAPDLGHPFSGSLADLSVPTLLSMFELEQRTGRLTLNTTVGALTLDLKEGKLGQTFLDGSPSDPVEALALVIDVRAGRFLFTPGDLIYDELTMPSGPMMSVGAVLLRVGQKNDEANRDAFGT